MIPPVVSAAAAVATAVYATAEIWFFWYFTYYLTPAANERTQPQPYRDYPSVTDRHRLLARILSRIEWTVLQQQQQQQQQQQRHGTRNETDLRNVIANFLHQWFYSLDDDDEEEAETVGEVHSSNSSSGNGNKLALQHKESLPAATTATAATDSSSDTSSLDGSEGMSAAASAAVLEDSNLSDDDDDDDDDDEEDEQYGDNDNVEVEATTAAAAPSPWTVPGLVKENVDEFFSWAFFGKHWSDLIPSELRELAFCYEEIERKLGLTFTEAAGSPADSRNVPRKMTLEDVNPTHRPLAIYLAVMFLKWVTGVFLRCVGFQRVVSNSTGLVGWYRPASTEASASGGRDSKEEHVHPPLLFFHGIAPGGLVFYLPMVLSLVSDGRAVFMFENPSISCCAIQFRVPSERETCRGVEEIVNTCLSDPSTPLSLCGHSFGSCPLTWLLHYRHRRDNDEHDDHDDEDDESCGGFRSRIRQLILINPVTILLSEPDVMTNFLYYSPSQKKISSSNKMMIRMLAATELFTEYSLRRHFAWYNSELWFEDVPDHVSVLVALSESDEIVNSTKVKGYMDMYRRRRSATDTAATAEEERKGCGSTTSSNNMRLLYWEGAGHAACVTNPDKWLLVRQAMLKQELEMYQQQQQQQQQQQHPLQ